MAPIARCLLATLAILLIPAIAWATPDVGAKHNGWSITEERYLETYEDCWDAFKARCGANLVDDNRADPLPAARINASTERMKAWLNPEPAPIPIDASSVSAAPTPVTTSVAPASASTGAYAVPSYIVDCESGGDYGASNPSGAYGAYQIMPGTAAAYGCDLSTPAGQDQCAGEIYADVGASAWACG